MYEDFSDTSEVLDCGSSPPSSVVRITHEMDALQASLQVVEGGGNREHAKLLGRTYLGRLNPDSIEELVTEAAIKTILGRTVSQPNFFPSPLPWETHVAESVALAWLFWASGDSSKAREAVHDLRSRQKKQKAFSVEGGALHLLTLTFWSEAVLRLATGDRPNARRFFKRAIDMGSQFGTDSHPMISWAYAASFFEA